MKCVSYTRTLPWKNHQGELTIAEQNQRIAAYVFDKNRIEVVFKYEDTIKEAVEECDLEVKLSA